MALAAFYDTDTTGLLRLDLPPNHRDQPHLVQVAALLVDLDTRLVVSTIDVLVRPAGWTIPDDRRAQRPDGRARHHGGVFRLARQGAGTMSSAATCPDCQTAPSALELARARDAGQKTARLDDDPATYEEYPYGSCLGAAFLQAYNDTLAEIAAWRASKGL